MQKKKGISLIVLVITIIVMIILAAAIILSLNNAGIIGNANKAVDESNIANVKAAADLVYADYLITGIGDKTEDALGTEITQKLVANNTIKGNDYYIKVFDGETYVIKEGSLIDQYYDKEIAIGDYIGYDAGVNEITVNQQLGEQGENNRQEEQVVIKSTSAMLWRVLGVEGDKLKLVSAEVVNPEGKTGFSLYGAYSYLKGVEILNNACSVFGEGEYAISSRSINADDVNEITGFDKTKYTSNIYQRNSYNIPMISDVPYGTNIIYDGKTQTIINNKKNVFGILKQPDIIAKDTNYVKEKSLIVQKTNYYYDAGIEMQELGTKTDPSKYSKEFKLIFRNMDNTGYVSYWLTTQMANAHHGWIDYGMGLVASYNYGAVGSASLHQSGWDGGIWGVTYEEDYDMNASNPLRPIVILEGNINAEKVLLEDDRVEENTYIWDLK